jgi:hypothetical protein
VPPGSLTTGGSVWWTWTAPQSTTLTIAIIRDNVSVNSTGTALWVYSGTDITSLTLLDGNSFDILRAVTLLSQPLPASAISFASRALEPIIYITTNGQ